MNKLNGLCNYKRKTLDQLDATTFLIKIPACYLLPNLHTGSIWKNKIDPEITKREINHGTSTIYYDMEIVDHIFINLYHAKNTTVFEPKQFVLPFDPIISIKRNWGFLL